MARLSAWPRRMSSPRHAGKRKSIRLAVEQLENRLLLSGSSGPQLAPGQAAPFVDSLYAVLLGRQPRPGEDAAWTAALDRGTTPAQVATGFLDSPEYRTRIVNEHYTKLLNRSPEPGATAAWLNVLRLAGSYQPMTTAVLASPEYYARQGGTAQAWITGLYHDLLGRQPDVAGNAAWLQQLAAGATRADVAAAFANSHEVQTLIVQEGYQVLLNRAPEDFGLNAWSGDLGGGMTVEQFVAGVVGSAEFIQRADNGLFPAASAAGAAGPAGAITPFASGPSQPPAGGPPIIQPLTSESTLSISIVPFSPIEGIPFTVTVATFTDSDGLTGPYVGTINWGDGTTWQGAVSGGIITGSHMYPEEKLNRNRYQVYATVTELDTDGDGPSPDATATTSGQQNYINVADAPLTDPNAGNPITFIAVKGQSWTGTVAQFIDKGNPPVPPTEMFAALAA